MQSKAQTVKDYLAELPEDRRAALNAVREVIRRNLDAEYEEGMQYGMIGYYVPHRVFPAGYHCDPKQPLPFAAVAAQKNHLAVYLMGAYLDSAEKQWFEDAWTRTGKKLDMGKSCLRFKKVEELALDVLGESIRRIPARQYISRYQAILASSKTGAAKSARAAKASGAAKSASAAKPASAAKSSSATKSASATKSSGKAKSASSARKKS